MFFFGFSRFSFFALSLSFTFHTVLLFYTNPINISCVWAPKFGKKILISFYSFSTFRKKTSQHIFSILINFSPPPPPSPPLSHSLKKCVSEVFLKSTALMFHKINASKREVKSNNITFLFIVRIRSIIKFHFYDITIIILTLGKWREKPMKTKSLLSSWWLGGFQTSINISLSLTRTKMPVKRNPSNLVTRRKKEKYNQSVKIDGYKSIKKLLL
jgi:hypothetical protein